MATHNVASWETWKPEIDTFIDDEAGSMPKPVYDQLFSTEQTDRLQRTDVGYSGLNPMIEVGEDGDSVEDSNLQGYKTVYSSRVFRKKTTFSSGLFETDQHGEVEKLARGLPRAVQYSRNLNIMGMLRNSFTTVSPSGLSTVGGDGKALISGLHPRKDGGSAQSNTFGDGVQRPLTLDNVLLLEDQLIAVVSNSGNLMTVGDESNNKLLVVSPYQREAAFQIAGVDGPDMKPDTNENDINYIRKGEKYDVLVTKWLSYEAAKQADGITFAKTSSSNFYDKMWFIVDTTNVKDYFKLYIRKGYASGQFDDEIQKSNQALVKYGYDKYMFGFSGWFPIAGSKGDGTTYSA